MRVHPLGDLVLVKILEQRSITPAGIHLPEEVKKSLNMNIGEVVEVGEGGMMQNGQRNPHVLKPGDTVMFSAAAHPFPVEWARTVAMAGLEQKAAGHQMKLAILSRYEIMARVEMDAQDRLVLVEPEAVADKPAKKGRQLVGA